MKYQSTLLSVKDMDKSVAFYHDLFAQEVICDYGANKTLTGGFALQTLDTWKEFIGMDNVVFKSNAIELYFEEDDLDGFINKLESKEDIQYVHKVKEHPWGQRGLRIYDPDGHIIEISETMDIVAKRFQKDGMTVEQIAIRMDIPLDNAKELLR